LNTPKALANFSPALEQSDNLGTAHKRRDENAFGVFKLNQYLIV